MHISTSEFRHIHNGMKKLCGRRHQVDFFLKKLSRAIEIMWVLWKTNLVEVWWYAYASAQMDN